MQSTVETRSELAEVWLRTNRRPLLLAVALCTGAFLCGLALATGLLVPPHAWTTLLGGSVALGAGILGGLALWQLLVPRLAFQRGNLLVYLKAGPPYRVPVEIVECLFLGQGPAMPTDSSPDAMQAANVVVRLAERASDWSSRRVVPAFGRWCDGYITISGTWCEPLDQQLVEKLNRQLASRKRNAR